MADVTLYPGRGLRATISFDYAGPAVDLILWWALVDGNSNPIPGPAANGEAVGGAPLRIGGPTAGQRISAPADMPVNNGTIPAGTYRARIRVLSADWATVYGEGYADGQVTVMPYYTGGVGGTISVY